MKKPEISRRLFLAGSAAAIAAGCATTGKKGKAPAKISTRSPNEKLNIAGIGAGGKGIADLSGCSSENIVALCDADLNQTRQMAAKHPNAKIYKDFRVMLEKQKDIDACTISTPDHFHAVAAMGAMLAGKHVYVQKPLTHTIWEARKLAETAREMKVATQMGNQGHSGDGVRDLCEMIWSGTIGQVKEVHCWTNRPIWPQGLNRPDIKDTPPKELDWDVWLGPAPDRPYVSKHPATGKNCYHPFVWRGWWDFGCGALGDMACHIMDPPNWAMKLGHPASVEVVSQEGLTSEQAPNKSIIKYEFPARGDMPALALYWHDGGNMPPRPANTPADEVLGEGDNGSLFIGEKGAISAHCYGEKPTLHPISLMKDYKAPPKTLERIPEEDHYKDWIQACKGGRPACSNFDYSGPFTEIVLLGNLALRTGKKLEWDGANMKVTNCPEANELVTKQYRKGWEIV